MKVKKILLPGKDLAVLKFKKDAAIAVQFLSMAHAAIVMHPNYPAVITGKHFLQGGLERPVGFSSILPELRKDGFTSFFKSGGRALARCVPGRILVKDFCKRFNISLVECFVTSSYKVGILFNGGYHSIGLIGNNSSRVN